MNAGFTTNGGKGNGIGGTVNATTLQHKERSAGIGGSAGGVREKPLGSTGCGRIGISVQDIRSLLRCWKQTELSSTLSRLGFQPMIWPPAAQGLVRLGILG